MRRTILFVIIGIYLGLSSGAQDKYACEIGMVSDNDAYLMLAIDQYYTNGLALFFRYAPGKFNEKFVNKIFEFKIGQKIYNPFQAYVPWIERIDKPFAGYLYVEPGIACFDSTESMYKASLQVGVIGPSSHAEEVQLFYHRLFNLYGVDGWQYQVHDAFGINISFAYLKFLKPFYDRHVDVSFHSEIRAGTIVDDISAGLLARASLYRLRPLYNSVSTGSRLNRNKIVTNDRELFFYIRPALSYVVFDATIQGGMFSENNPVTFDVRPVKFSLEAGITGSYKRLNAGYSVIFQTRDAKNNLVKNHIYGSIYLACLF